MSVSVKLIDDYQMRLVEHVREVIETNWWQRRPKIRILDMGCDTTGAQLAHLAMETRGEVVGINIPESFPTKQAKETAGARVSLIRMDGAKLSFDDESFDLVISANVIEHVCDIEQYLSECARVLKRSGIAYLETAPVWSGPRGHHIHPDMIAGNCPEETEFSDDGSVVPHWGHLLFTEEEMRKDLERKLNPKTIDYICQYIYHSSDLNRIPWSGIKSLLEGTFRYCRIATLNAEPTEVSSLKGADDHSVHGFTAVCRKYAPNPVARRLIWRLRRIGL